MKFKLSRQILGNNSNIKFYQNPPVGAELFHADGQTGGHDEAKSHFLQFCERA
jgi:hypothetical protein